MESGRLKSGITPKRRVSPWLSLSRTEVGRNQRHQKAWGAQSRGNRASFCGERRALWNCCGPTWRQWEAERTALGAGAGAMAGRAQGTQMSPECSEVHWCCRQTTLSHSTRKGTPPAGKHKTMKTTAGVREDRFRERADSQTRSPQALWHGWRGQGQHEALAPHLSAGTSIDTLCKSSLSRPVGDGALSLEARKRGRAVAQHIK